MKKWIKISSLALVVLILVFFSLGLIQPTFNYQNKVLVNRGVTETFLKFNDPTRLKNWIPGYKQVEWLGGFPGQTGSQWRLTVVQDGKEYKMTETLRALKINELFAYHLENDVLDSDVNVHFKAMGAQTEIIADNQVRGKNLFWRSLFVFFKHYFYTSQQQSYENLKKEIER